VPDAGSDAPLPSAAEEEAEEEELETEIDREDARPRPASPGFKFSTFLYTFLFLLGILMIFDTSTREGVALAFDRVLSPLIGFGGRYPLLTMFLAAAFEMLLTAVAYNYTTDWIKAARVQKWSAALRKVQMAAMRSGKKDRIAALQVHQQTLARLSTEVSFAQLKGMAITWFLVIALYTWVYIFLVAVTGAVTLVHAQNTVVQLGAAHFDLAGPTFANFPVLQNWFLVFTLYTVPLSLVFRRLLKHYSLAKYATTQLAPPVPPAGRAGEAA
jgi:uncharacterized membrane protein (DUF106 family)